MQLHLTILLILILLSKNTGAQSLAPANDSTQLSIDKLSPKYLEQLAEKSSKYYDALTSKTEKTLERLSKWEAKIKTVLDKVSPETAQRLFANPDLTFAGLLQKFREGKAAADNYKATYNEYRDKVTTTLKYLDEKKTALDSTVLKRIKSAKEKDSKLNEQLKNTEAVSQFIRERKKQLMEQALKYVGNSKALQKINKDSYYYFETLRNYKTLFSEPRRAEELALKLLHKINGFDDFLRRNSMLASLFRTPDAGAGTASLAGLQTRSQVNNLIQQQIAAGGSNAREQFQQNLQAAQGQLSELKNKIIKAGGSSSGEDIPEGFKRNEQRGKPLKKKIEFSINAQSNRGNSLFPVSSDFGLSAGFRPHQNFVSGFGIAGRIGWGKDLRHISLSYSGISLRSFAELKLKGSFHATAGFEINYRPEIRSLDLLKDYSSWQRSGLVGIAKTVSIKSKFFKKTSVRLMWDFLSFEQVPRTQPVIFRISYGFK
ncbi:MAG: hypothetical protein NTW29_19560 [Bacteroidetes bacterium]|nr:hypothetical protein [Bacteroidota bacterium]